MLNSVAVGHPVDHERREHLTRVEQHQIAGRFDFVDLHVARPQFEQQRVAMLRGGDHEAWLSERHPFAEKVGDGPA